MEVLVEVLHESRDHDWEPRQGEAKTWATHDVCGHLWIPETGIPPYFSNSNLPSP